VFPDVKSRIQTFLHWSSRRYREESTGQPTLEMFCFLVAMPTKTRRLEREGSLSNML